MQTFVFAFITIVVAIGGLAIGVMAGRPSIKGSCGGLSCIKGIDCVACKARRRMEDRS